MKKFLAVLFILPMLAMGFEAFTPTMTQEANAARLGGGRSFGGRPSYNRAAPAPQRSAQPGQQSATGAPMGMRGGMGGFLGPLLAGSMLGALFFGGAFSGIGFADILMIGLVILLVTRLRRRPTPAPAGASRHGGATQGGLGNGPDAWSALRDNRSTSGVSSAASGLRLPDDFDVEKFVEGAKMMYARMQESWDKRDLEDIAQFTTPGMYKLVEAQAQEDPTPSRTDILTLNGVVYGFERDGADENVSVYFDALLREYADQGADNAREIWHFIRLDGGNWKLDGIQQVEG